MTNSGVIEPLSMSWQEANLVAQVNARKMPSPKPNPLQELFPWFKGVRLYYETETEQIGCGVPTEADRQAQKRMLAVLINLGEWLVLELRREDVTAKVGLTLRDVEATLDELYL